MTDRPIIFSAPMIRALWDGRKNQTRRVLKPQPTVDYLTSEHLEDHELRDWTDVPFGERWATVKTMPYATGDRLYVREAHTLNPAVRHHERIKNVIYRADVPTAEPPLGEALTLDRMRWLEAQELRWRPSIHMPRWASRLTLIVTDVRVQQLQDISEEDAVAEGVRRFGSMWSVEKDNGHGAASNTAAGCFRLLWNSIHGPDAWDRNDWVTALTFDVHRCNIDQMGGDT